MRAGRPVDRGDGGRLPRRGNLPSIYSDVHMVSRMMNISLDIVRPINNIIIKIKTAHHPERDQISFDDPQGTVLDHGRGSQIMALVFIVTIL